MGELFDYAKQNAERYRSEPAEEAKSVLAEQRLTEYISLMRQYGVQPHPLYEYAGQSKIPVSKLIKAEFVPFMPQWRRNELQRTTREYKVVATGWQVMSTIEYGDGSSSHGVFATEGGGLRGSTIDVDHDTDPTRSTLVEYNAGREALLHLLNRHDTLDRMSHMLGRYGILNM